jgi:endonuclease III
VLVDRSVVVGADKPSAPIATMGNHSEAKIIAHPVAKTPRIPKPPKSAAETRAILAKLEKQHPDADTELHYTTPYELLVATILSAQCTDERVNQVTPALFTRYPDARVLAKATTAELEPQIQSTGFFRAKSKSLLGMATAVTAKHGGEIPATMADLTALPGVGRKTANVVLNTAFGHETIAVDTHIFRVANRTGIAPGKDVREVEDRLMKLVPEEFRKNAHHWLILHGRYVCKALKPECPKCPIRDLCEYRPKTREKRTRA